MIKHFGIILTVGVILLCGTCGPSGAPQAPMASDASVVLLHHSTGGMVWGAGVPEAMDTINANLGTAYAISEQAYPNEPSWPWANYPSDYYRLWVGGEGSATDPNIYNLETLCGLYDVIVWKHCFPVTYIDENSGKTDPAGPQTLANYEAAYNALKTKMHEFPNKRFIVWTGAVTLHNTSSPNDEAQHQRLKQFRDWVIRSWDEKGDNIYVFDFWLLETGSESNIYLPATSSDGDDHPGAALCASVAPKFAKRVADVLRGRGDLDPLTGY